MFSILNRFIYAYKHYDKCYVCIDIHGTIFKPTFSVEENFKYYPFAKKTLQLMSECDDTIRILWSGCYKNGFKKYLDKLFSDNILIHYINENPECENNEYACFDEKMYVDVGLDDKFGFNPYIHWFMLYIFFYIKTKFFNYEKNT